MYLCEVFVTNASLNVNHTFTYFSNYKIEKYCRVKLKFHNAVNYAIVISCSYTDKTIEEINEEFGYKVLEVEEVIDQEPILNDEMYELALWLAKTTISPVVSCINSLLPNLLKTKKSIKNPKMVEHVRKNHFVDFKSKKQQEVYNSIKDDMLAKDARALSTSIFNKLIEYGAIEIYLKEAKYKNNKISSTSFKTLTDDQLNVYNSFLETDKQVSLLFGVTGSGKTEVYLHLARYYLSLGKEVLILVPEISLTPQMIQRVKERFEDVVFYHSELNEQEKYQQYSRIKNGEVKIVVGTRSAIFLPFKDLGLIIVDEEHDQSYKQDSTPTYHVRNVAIKRAINFKSKVLFASATPSLESYTRAKKGDYKLLRLDKRINEKLPKIEVVDLNKEIKEHGSYILSSNLKNELTKCLNNQKQAIILLNRRGYSPIMKCSDCSSTLMCSDCDIPLNYHAKENILKCHTCGKTYKMIDKCPKCGGKLIRYGFGTEKVEEELHRLYPNANIERMDRDTTSRKGSHEAILKRFEERKIDILIGTQMISKGLDYPDVTLVGILNADNGLMHQDYNASKLTFDLLMQASGRSGRANEQGKVLIQAFNYDHYAIKAVIKQDYEYFYNIEMNYRKKANYPPYSNILAIYLFDSNENRLYNSLDTLTYMLDKLPFKIYKPVEISKIKSQHRFRILIINDNIIDVLNSINKVVLEYTSKKNLSSIRVDLNPFYLE